MTGKQMSLNILSCQAAILIGVLSEGQALTRVGSEWVIMTTSQYNTALHL